MARTVADRNLGTREARRRLAARRKPYWRAIERGLHVGYYKGSRGGRWIARRYCGEGRYQETVVGTADDVLDADGRAILDFDQAQAGAREWFHAEVRRAAGEAPEAGPFTVSRGAGPLPRVVRPAPQERWSRPGARSRRTSGRRSVSSRSPN